MKTLIDACGGISKGAKFMTSTGADASFTKLDPMVATVERSIPLKAHKDAILAWEVNGEQIPNAHEHLEFVLHSLPKLILHLYEL